MSRCVFAGGGGRVQPADVIECTQAEPERGPLLAACSTSKSLCFRYTLTQGTGERNGSVQTALTDTSACLTRFWTKDALLERFCIPLKWSELKPERKKDGATRKGTFVDFAGQSGVCCSVWKKSGEKKRVYSSWKDLVKENQHMLAPILALYCMSFYLCFGFPCD